MSAARPDPELGLLAAQRLDGDLDDQAWRLLCEQHGPALQAALREQESIAAAVRQLPRVPAADDLQTRILAGLPRPPQRRPLRLLRYLPAVAAAAGIALAFVLFHGSQPDVQPGGNVPPATGEVAQQTHRAPVTAAAPLSAPVAAPPPMGNDQVLAMNDTRQETRRRRITDHETAGIPAAAEAPTERGSADRLEESSAPAPVPAPAPAASAALPAPGAYAAGRSLPSATPSAVNRTPSGGATSQSMRAPATEATMGRATSPRESASAKDSKAPDPGADTDKQEDAAAISAGSFGTPFPDGAQAPATTEGAGDRLEANQLKAGSPPASTSGSLQLRFSRQDATHFTLAVANRSSEAITLLQGSLGLSGVDRSGHACWSQSSGLPLADTVLLPGEWYAQDLILSGTRQPPAQVAAVIVTWRGQGSPPCPLAAGAGIAPPGPAGPAHR